MLYHVCQVMRRQIYIHAGQLPEGRCKYVSEHPSIISSARSYINTLRMMRVFNVVHA